jgi:proton glutamate symport protein
MASFLRRISLTQWIVISMFVGAAVGYYFPVFSKDLNVFSKVFLNLIKSVLVPLVFGTLVVGVAGHAGEMRAVGRLAFKAILYFEIVTTLALMIGLAAVNLARPGHGMTLPAATSPADLPAKTHVTFSGILEHMAPRSFFEAAANNDVLQVVCFSILFAIAMTQAPPKARQTMLGFCDALTEIMFKFVGVVMKVAPIGVGAAIAYTVGQSGFEVLKNLIKLIATLYVALFAFMLLVLVPVAWMCRIPVIRFMRFIREPALLAFSTTSSDAALPDAMKRMIAFGVPKEVVSFVMPLGYTFNLDGSTLYLAVASVFIAQAAGMELSVAQQVSMMVTLMLTSKGMAGVPRASQVILAGTLVTFGLPLQGLTLIIAVDTLMDMGRTVVNLIGNCLAAAVMARWEGVLGPGAADPDTEACPTPQ